MAYNPALHHRRSIRLKDYDYTQTGVYFVTVVAQERLCLFGEVADGAMRLNDTGRLIAEVWRWLASQYPYVDLDEYIIMPNHLHGLIGITDNGGRGGSRAAPAGVALRRIKPLGRLIGAFKTVSTKQVNRAQGAASKVLWQRNYYERVIRNERELAGAREYILNNPLHWDLDKENPTTVRTLTLRRRGKGNAGR